MQKIAQWCAWDGQGQDYCTFSQGKDWSSLEGVVIGFRGSEYGAHYEVRVDSHFRTREVRVKYVAGHRLHVATDGKGRWHDLISDAPLASLDGCFDVDIGVTPATNTLPILRLQLAEGERQDIVVAYIPLPSQIEGDFLPRPARQRYSCLVAGQRYLYEGIFRAFSAELEVDDSGLVLDYPETFRRIKV